MPRQDAYGRWIADDGLFYWTATHGVPSRPSRLRGAASRSRNRF